VLSYRESDEKWIKDPRRENPNQYSTSKDAKWIVKENQHIFSRKK